MYLFLYCDTRVDYIFEIIIKSELTYIDTHDIINIPLNKIKILNTRLSERNSVLSKKKEKRSRQ